MRYFFTTVFCILTLSTSGLASVNFDGVWALDLKASDSPEQMLKRMGVSFMERKLAASTTLESTYHPVRESSDRHHSRTGIFAD